MPYDNRRLIYFLPNIFTALNMASGFLSIILSFKHDYYYASIFIIIAVLFDTVDGRVARLTGTQSSFGEQFDSLSDLISFGFAPAVLFYNRFLYFTERVGLVVAFIFLLCGALRLARFNANIEKIKSDYFQGLPIPGAASAVTGYVLLSLQFPVQIKLTWFSVIYLLLYAMLMISSIPFPSFKNSPWVKNHQKQVLMVIFTALASLFIYEEVMLISLITTYVIISIFYAFTHKEKFAGIFNWKNDSDVEV